MFCTMALVLAADVSASVLPQHLSLQREGYAAAFRSAQVVSLIEDHAPVAVTYVEWADQQKQILGWRVLEDAADVARFASELQAAAAPVAGTQTALGEALRYSISLLQNAPCEASRRLIDISGDGASNYGVPADVVRDEAEELNITVNALPIQSGEPGVVGYYEKNVVTRRGFVIEAVSYEALSTAIKRKLQREIALGE